VRVLTLDIETSPNLAHVWSLWKQNVSLSQLQESGEVIAFAAKWHGEKDVEFYSNFTVGHEAMVREAHRLLSAADVVVHYNGTSFDIPHLNREFLSLGLPPPRPYKQVDLLKVARDQFKFVSNKLDYVSQYVGLKGKVSHEGHMLWVKCMAGDPKAWATMEKYNKYDVVLTEKLYDILLPWIKGHPHPALYDETVEPTCQRCGSTDLIKQGFAYTTLAAYQQWQCKKCGSWSRSARREFGVGERGVS
jgi:DNA polymerase elongation subunit (family B)